MGPRIALVALTLSACALAQDIVLPDGKAKKIVEQTCTECHGLEHVVNASLSPDEWKHTVDNMIKRGATLSKEDRETVLEYLAVYFAQEKVNVNTASVVQLQSTLELTAAEADAIIEHRKANGKFKDLESLRKVTGVDAKKIDAKKDLVTF